MLATDDYALEELIGTLAKAAVRSSPRPTSARTAEVMRASANR
jgi:hypothetical protein